MLSQILQNATNTLQHEGSGPLEYSFLMQIYFLFDDPPDMVFDAHQFFSWYVTPVSLSIFYMRLCAIWVFPNLLIYESSLGFSDDYTCKQIRRYFVVHNKAYMIHVWICMNYIFGIISNIVLAMEYVASVYYYWHFENWYSLWMILLEVSQCEDRVLKDLGCCWWKKKPWSDFLSRSIMCSAWFL